jgi:HCNGP-like protein
MLPAILNLQRASFSYEQIFFQNIRSNKNFGNPYIFGKAVEHFQIDEIGSNYPTDIFDPHGYQEVTTISYYHLIVPYCNFH